MYFRLKELRFESGLKRSEFAKEIGIHPNTIANYENATRQAPYEVLLQFAEYFDVTLDYLLGRDVDAGTKEDLRKIVRKNLILNQSERNLVSEYRKLTQKAKNRVAEYIELWQGQPVESDSGEYPEI